MEDDNEAKHWFVRRQPRPLNQTYVDQVDEVFRNRWRTLLSVDDLVDDVFTKLTDAKLLENTIALYTSDHGYHLGNYGLPLDKRMPYDTGMIEIMHLNPNHFKKLNFSSSFLFTCSEYTGQFWPWSTRQASPMH